MRVLLLGDKGYLGSYLASKLTVDVSPVGKYDYVINCIGLPDLEFCDENPDMSRGSNYSVVENVVAEYPTARFVHFSSYYVYNDDGLCDEHANVTRNYCYTRDKLDSEDLVKNIGVVFRIGKLFGHPTKKQNKFTDYIIDNDTMTVDKVRFNPTSLQQVYEAVNFELQNQILTGIWNLSNNEVVSHSTYALYISARQKKWKQIETVDKLQRYFCNYGRFAMDTSKIASYLNLRDWREDIDVYLKEIENA